MSWRIQKRTNLFGGLGLNWSKSGVSPSLRTSFGSISPKGGSLKTGIPGLYFRWYNSKRTDAKKFFTEEFKNMEEKCQGWINLCPHLNYLINDVPMDYPSEIHLYQNLINKMKEFIELGSEIDDELESLQAYSRENNLGMIRLLDEIRIPLDKEMEKVIWSLTETLRNIANYNAKNNIQNEFSRDLISSNGCAIEDTRIDMTCDSCGQNIS